MSSLRWLAFSSALLFVLAATTGCQLLPLIASDFDFDLDFDIDPDSVRFDASQTWSQEVPYAGQKIVLENTLGKITVVGSEEPAYVAVRPFVYVSAVKKVRGMPLNDVKILLQQGGNEIRIRTDAPSSLRRRVRLFPPQVEERVAWVEYTLKVPQGANLVLSTDIGAMLITQLRGSATASARLGTITATDSSMGTLSMDAQLGAVRLVDSIVEELTIDTSLGTAKIERGEFSTALITAQAGSIEVAGAKGGRLTAKTQRGSIDITAAQLQSALLKTQAGSITVKSSTYSEGQMSTQVGSILVELPQSASMRVEAKTQLGSIRLRGLEPASAVQRERGSSWPGKDLVMTLADGQGKLELSTQVGSIKIVFIQ